jgi:hypothetical protein
MTAALIFRRQLVRHKSHLFTAISTADKLPLEKFHRLLDLVFWGKFFKFDSISCFVFLWDVNRVSPGITGYHRVSPGITGYHSTRFFFAGPAALHWRGRGGVPRLAAPPGPRFPIAKFWYCLQRLQRLTMSYTVQGATTRLKRLSYKLYSF